MINNLPMRVSAVIERNIDGKYCVYMDDDSLEFGVNGFGNTVEEAKNDIMLAYAEIKKVSKEEFNKLVSELKEIPGTRTHGEAVDKKHHPVPFSEYRAVDENNIEYIVKILGNKSSIYESIK